MYYDAKKHFANHGVVAENVSIDLGAMMAQKDRSVKGLTSGIEGLFKKNKSLVRQGLGSFASANEVKVALLEGGEQTIQTKNVIIATGSDVSSVPGLSIDEERCAAASSIPIYPHGGAFAQSHRSVFRHTHTHTCAYAWCEAA